MKNKNYLYSYIILIAFLVVYACKTHDFRSNYSNANSLIHQTNGLQTLPFLKIHLKNGDVCILRDTWKIDTLANLVNGFGTRYDFNRNKIMDGILSVQIDSVIIFETNTKLLKPEQYRIAALGILTAVDVIFGIYCLNNPKACFGSCPTFYLNEKDNFHFADAEGFSNAITPSMEYADIDALTIKTPIDSLFSITMKNEALETHCVNEVKLLAYPKKSGEHIYQSSKNDFYLCENNYPVNEARGMEGNISDLLKKEDRIERFSLSDKNNLSSKEEVYLTFEEVQNPKNLGLILNFRQTLMTTYLFYSAMGYMGDNVSDVFSMLEKNERKGNKFDALSKELGGISIFTWSEKNNSWEFEGELKETGPIAINKQIIPIENKIKGSSVKLKIVLNKGYWRMDYCALTNIKEKVVPTEILPSSITNKGILDTKALADLNDSKTYLISMPGSSYKINFNLPKSNTDYELFLYSKGYYLEWMRNHWLQDKSLYKLTQMVKSPKVYLKSVAKEYKRYEMKMEQEFWDSKIDTKTFSYHEK